MTKKVRILIVLLSLTLLGALNEIAAQPPDRIDELIKQLESQEWQKREQAASALLGLPPELKSERVMLALVNELEKQFFTGGHKYEGEGELDYSMWLMNELASLREERAFQLIVKIGAPSAMLQYGDEGVQAMIEKLSEKKNCSERIAIVHYLGEVLKPEKEGYIAQGTIRNDIKFALLKGVNESGHPKLNQEHYEAKTKDCANVRARAVKALGYIAKTGDTEVLSIIEALAKNDPYYWVPKGRPDEEKERRYDVRDEARKVMDKLKTRNEKK